MLLTRDAFREGVFARDGYKCVFCGEPAKDAHHIIERRLFSDGGYYLNNGASVCEEHHLACEMTVISVEEVRDACGIKKAVIPDHFYHDHQYDKWGNLVLPDGRRLKGELFNDPSVQKILEKGGVLDLFTSYVKYPRTHHLPWSEGLTEDDRMIHSMDTFIGQRVIVSEKMDGECLLSSTKITMNDNTKISIGDLVRKKLIGKFVKGVDENGNIVDSKITNVFYNGTTKDWLSVNVKGSKSKYQSVRCTKNHKFSTPNGYVKAENLNIGDTVFMFEEHRAMTSLQKEILLGKLLGDGSLHLVKSNSNSHKANVKWGHKKSHNDYIEWTKNLLGDISRKSIQTKSGYGSDIIVTYTEFMNDIYDTFFPMFVNKIKTFPTEFISMASVATLAFWYMDDGSLTKSHKQRDRALFSVCGFDEKSCDNLVKLLAKFGIKSSIKTYDYRYLFVGADSTEILFNLIKEYVPSCMEYKISEKYRNGNKISTPTHENIKYLKNREISVVSVNPYLHNSNRGKYDIETETHNYFANGILVHNCTSLYRDYIHARSVDGRNHPSRAWVKNFWGQICGDIPEGWRVCGENLYARHSIGYDELPTYFMGFSIWNDRNECLSWDETQDWFALLGITPVPLLYDGIYDEKVIRKLYDSKNDWDRSEGYVLRIADKFDYGQFRSHIGKFVRKNHVQTAKHHWQFQEIVPNKLV